MIDYNSTEIIDELEEAKFHIDNASQMMSSWSNDEAYTTRIIGQTIDDTVRYMRTKNNTEPGKIEELDLPETMSHTLKLATRED